jgi:hypothetical protein
MSNRIEIPTDTAQILLAKKISNKTSTVSIGDDGKLLPNGNENTKYKITIRKVEKAGERGSSGRAMKLKACKGLKGCDFAECSKDAFGKLPKNLEGLCSTNGQNTDKSNVNV